jgi:hypothetical protein
MKDPLKDVYSSDIEHKGAKTMVKAIATFASKTKVGEKYLTKSGVPVTVKSIGSSVTITAHATGNTIVIPAGYLLFPYSREGINKDSRILMGVTDAHTVNTEAIKSRIDHVGKHRTLKRTYKGIEHIVTVKADGFEYNGDHFSSLTAIAMKIRGGKPESGPKFFGVKPEARS